VNFLRSIIGSDDAVWYDDGLRGGEAWWDEIVKQLHSRNAFIVILSPDAVRSPYVKEEIRIALQRHLEGKMLFLPLLLRKCRPPQSLRTRQILSFLSKEEYEQSFKKMFEALGLPPHIDSSTFLNTDSVESANQSETDIENTLSGKQEQLLLLKFKDVEQMFLMVEDAFKMQNWDYVIAVTGALIKLYPEALPASIYYMRGRAYLYTETVYDDQYTHAEEALEYALDRVQDPNFRIELLDAYALCLVQQNKSKELESCIDQALQLSPADPVWKLLREEMVTGDAREDELQSQLSSLQVGRRTESSETESRQVTSLSGSLKKHKDEKQTTKGRSIRRLGGVTLLLATPFLIFPVARRILRKQAS
jgi:tetratricopeptide (TPR) repeat protein